MTVEALSTRPVIRRGLLRPDEIRSAQRTHDYLRRAAETRHPVVKARILDKAVLVHLPVADGLAIRYSGRGIPTDDLVQVARLGLVRAVHRFNPRVGADFISFAVPTILGELKRHFRDQGWAVRPTRRIEERRPRILADTSTLTQAQGRSLSRAEVARHLDVDEVLRTLSDRDLLVLHLRLVDDMTQEVIGSIVGITQAQVSRILVRIVRLMINELAA